MATVMNAMFPYANLFRRFALGICRYPAQLRILEATPEPQKIALFVTANPTDARFLCGPGAATIKALQTIFRCIAMENRHFITIDVKGFGQAPSTDSPPPRLDANWGKTNDAVDLLTSCLEAMNLKDIDLVTEEQSNLTVITLRTPEIPDKLMAAFNEAMNEWGKGQGRKIMVVAPKMVRVA